MFKILIIKLIINFSLVVYQLILYSKEHASIILVSLIKQYNFYSYFELGFIFIFSVFTVDLVKGLIFCKNII